MKTIDDIKLYDWYTKRQLDFIPRHFTICENSSANEESIAWINDVLVGRFAFSSRPPRLCPAFEDPAEASYYQLRWG